jgi:2-desacetyl-2-hydroxyethyl bacteriochlorophyllide A dehydrogenase
MMETLVCIAPGTFEYKKAKVPEVEKGEALIKIRRIGICGTDLHAYEGTQPFFNYPRILGHELAGDLVQVNSEDFSIGDVVTIIPYFNCNNCIACMCGKPNCCVNLKVCGVHQDGGMVEYLKVPTSSLIKGNDLSYEQLSMVEPLAIGAHGLARAQIKEEDFVLVVGAGPIGLGIIQLASIAGANVIVADVNDNRLAFCKTIIGAHHTINPTKENVVERLLEITNQNLPSVVIDATGNLKAIDRGFEYISHSGVYVLVGLQKNAITFSHPLFHKKEATLMSSRNATKTDFLYVMNLMMNGSIDVNRFITHKIGFDQVKNEFPKYLDPDFGVIKAVIEL